MEIPTNVVKITKLSIEEGGNKRVIVEKNELNEFLSKKMKVTCLVSQRFLVVRLNRLNHDEILYHLNPSGI